MDQIEQFLTTHQDADGNLSEADMGRLLRGDFEGDTPSAGQPGESGAPDTGSDAKETASTKEGGEPASTPEPAKGPEPKEGDQPTDEPVILARDGKHTIPYDRLTEAREEAKAAREEAARLRAELTAKAAGAPEAPTADQPDALRADVDALKFDQQQRVAHEHFRTIRGAHPDFESVAESAEFSKWLGAQPSVIRNAYSAVLQQGTAGEVVEMLDAYRAAHPAKPAQAPAPAAAAANVDQQVNEAIAKAKGGTPASLSDIPAGSAAHHDEAEAMAEMNPLALMGKFAGKSHAEIEAMVRRLV